MTDAQTHAWLFLSVPQEPAPLQNVIAVADGINHAIPTDRELQVSMGWLQAQGLVRKDGGMYSLTPPGIALRAECSATTMMKTWQTVTARLAAFAGASAPEDDVSSAEVAAAYEGYRAWARTFLKKLLK
jgi:hypothetical protein